MIGLVTDNRRGPARSTAASLVRRQTEVISARACSETLECCAVRSVSAMGFHPLESRPPGQFLAVRTPGAHFKKRGSTLGADSTWSRIGIAPGPISSRKPGSTPHGSSGRVFQFGQSGRGDVPDHAVGDPLVLMTEMQWIAGWYRLH